MPVDQLLRTSPVVVVIVCMGIYFLDQVAFRSVLFEMAVTRLDVFWFKLLVEYNATVAEVGLATIAGSLVLAVVVKGYKAQQLTAEAEAWQSSNGNKTSPAEIGEGEGENIY